MQHASDSQRSGGTPWTGRFTIPELHGQALRKTLETLSFPRRHNRTSNGQPVQDPTIPGMGHRLSWTEHLGAAFVELLEHLPTTGHARTGINLVVHVTEEQLRTGAGAARLETGGEISIGEARASRRSDRPCAA